MLVFTTCTMHYSTVSHTYCTCETETILVKADVWLKKMSKCGFGCTININLQPF